MIVLAWLTGLVGIEVGFQVEFVVLVGVLSFALEVVPVAAKGLTLGKVLLREQVVDDVGGGPVGTVAATLRWLVLYGPALVPFVGPVVLAANLVLVVVHGRGLHDFAARTIVVPIDDRELPV
ncbi:MAG: RDD family protein, partial [Acidimicrobiales bacterium]